ncbi:MAG TPA: hypothetical protein VH186_01105 [Chloroflexia bacterium]|nr:hypothetical protein [Chloroflexia bacterium]
MLRRATAFYPLAVTVLFGLLVSLLPISPALGDNIGACQGNTASSATLKLGGRPIDPNQILLANGTQVCVDGGKKVNLISMSRTIIVSPNGTPTENGTALLTAMTTISNSNPSVDNPWLLKLEPGNYDLGAGSLTLLPYVDLEGSGDNNTVISSTIASPGTLQAASHSETRFVQIINSGSTTGTGVYVPAGSTDVRFTHVTVISNSAIGNHYGILTADNSSSSGPVTVQESTISASGGSNSFSIYTGSKTTTTVQNSTVTTSGAANVSDAIVNYGTVTVLNSAVTTSGGATSYGLVNAGTARVGASQLSGSSAASVNLTLCPASFNGATFQPLNANCQ